MPHVVIIGSGIAGLFTAIQLAEADFDVTIITKKRTEDSSTNWAQGGIAGILDKTNLAGIQSHIEDTLNAGDGVCEKNIVEMVVHSAHQRIHELIEYGVEFQRTSSGQFSTAREGGHSEHRILHAKDATGREIERALIQKTEQHPRINIQTNTLAIDLIQREYHQPAKGVAGVWCLDQDSDCVRTIEADAVVLATGGVGVLWEKTTHPDVATGDGIAMAHRFGAAVQNMAFVQFHPTASTLNTHRPFLITEALRGHGAVLLDNDGLSTWLKDCELSEAKPDPSLYSFTTRFSDLGSMATRDVLARAIDSILKKTADPNVFLVTSHLEQNALENAFPTMKKHLHEHGLQLGIDPIPVAPAAHYMVGGIMVNKNAEVLLSESNKGIPRLYAIGETACTGMHGANRLASNSLLEAVVYAHNSAQHIISSVTGTVHDQLPSWRDEGLTELQEHAPLMNDLQSLQHTMFNEVGIVRTNRRLYRAKRRVELLMDEINLIWQECKPTRELIELRNLVVVGHLVIKDACAQSENRGLHFNVDLEDVSSESEM